MSEQQDGIVVDVDRVAGSEVVSRRVSTANEDGHLAKQLRNWTGAPAPIGPLTRVAVEINIFVISLSLLCPLLVPSGF